MKSDEGKAVRNAAGIACIAAPYSSIERASLAAARLIEAAMDACGAEDIKALERLMDARRALSPIVDRRIVPIEDPNKDKAAF